MEKLNGYTICELDNGSFVIQATEYDAHDDAPSNLRGRYGQTEFVTYSQAVFVLATHLLSEIG